MAEPCLVYGRSLVRAELDAMSGFLSICKCFPVAIDFDSSFIHRFAGRLLRAKWEIH